MKVAKPSPQRHKESVSARATLTLSADTYRKIDELRAGESRSAWVQHLIEQEEARVERVRLIKTLRAEYTSAVCLETLAVNDEFPVHER